MNFDWTPHRFSGGVLALDVANTVVLRHDAVRRVDRLADGAAYDAFPAAAARHCNERDLAHTLLPVPFDQRALLLELREMVDAYLRNRVTYGKDDSAQLANCLSAAAACLRACRGVTSRLDAATARSALRLLGAPPDGRLKICPNCGWLFVDRSRNRSRQWCDMNVCGNRQKARRHYQRKTGVSLS